MKSEVVHIQSSPTIVAGADSSLIGLTTAVRPAAGSGNAAYPTACIIRIPSGAQTVYFGGSAVTTETGTPFAAGEDLEVDLMNEILYAVVSTTSQTVYILRRGD